MSTSRCVHVGFLSQQHREALSVARVRAAASGLSQASAWPQPLSPYNWKLVASDGERHQLAHVNLRDHTSLPLPGLLGSVARGYGKEEWIELSRGEDDFSHQAWYRPEFTPFRKFAKLHQPSHSASTLAQSNHQTYYQSQHHHQRRPCDHSSEQNEGRHQTRTALLVEFE